MDVDTGIVSTKVKVPMKANSSKSVTKQFFQESFAPEAKVETPTGKWAAVVEANPLMMNVYVRRGAAPPRGAQLLNAVGAPVRQLFELNHRIVVLTFDSPLHVPEMKGAEQASRNAKATSGAEPDRSDTNPDPVFSSDEPLPDCWNVAMRVDRYGFRAAASRWVCASLIRREVPGLQKIPENCAIWIIGGYNECGMPTRATVLEGVSTIEVSNSKLYAEWPGEGEFQLFYAMTLLLRRPQLWQRRGKKPSPFAPADGVPSFTVVSTDTDVLILGLIWQEKLALSRMPMPEVQWLYEKQVYNRLGSALNLSLIHTKVCTELHFFMRPALVLAQTYFAAGSDFTDGFMELTHKVAFEAMFEEARQLLPLFSGTESQIRSPEAFEKFVRTLLSYRTTTQVIREAEVGVSFAAVCQARFLQFSYALEYYKQVGGSHIILEKLSAERGYCAVDPALPISRDNVARIAYIL